jgi:hypothetical protein
LLRTADKRWIWLSGFNLLVSSGQERFYEVEFWPAAGSVDTEIRCLMELEVSNAETEVQPRVQA